MKNGKGITTATVCNDGSLIDDDTSLDDCFNWTDEHPRTRLEREIRTAVLDCIAEMILSRFYDNAGSIAFIRGVLTKEARS